MDSIGRYVCSAGCGAVLLWFWLDYVCHFLVVHFGSGLVFVGPWHGCIERWNRV